MDEKYFWCSGTSGRLELELTMNEAETGHHQGDCEADVNYLLSLPHIKEQVESWDKDTLRGELSEYGAWDEQELSDHEMNKVRMLWLACGDITENPECYKGE